MKSKLYISAITVLILCGCIGIWFSSSLHGRDVTYEVRTDATIPLYGGAGSTRTIEAYERLVNRYISTMEENQYRINTNVISAISKLESIDEKIDSLSKRIGRIEKKIGLRKIKAKPKVKKLKSKTQKESEKSKTPDIAQ